MRRALLRCSAGVLVALMTTGATVASAGVVASAVPGAATGALARGASWNTPQAFEERVDELVRDGYEHAADSVRALDAMLAQAHGADEQRQLLQAIGSVEAQAGQAVAAGLKAEQLSAMAGAQPGSLAAASAGLVRALIAENRGQLDVAAMLAQAALPVFSAGCESAEAPGTAARAAATPAACEYRSAWRALQVLQRRALSVGLPVGEATQARAGLALAERAGDTRRQATNLGALALLAQGRGEPVQADQLIARARRLSARDAQQQSRLLDIEARLDSLRGEHLSALRHLEEARAMAAAASAPRLEARMLTNLSDAYARLDRPLDALRAAEQALPVVQRNNDQSTERVLINNVGIAKIGLGRIAEGRADMAELLAMWQRSGETGRQAETLREFGEALASAGDARSALELFHQEQALSAELMKANRTLALKDLQARNEADARQRDIEALRRDNDSKSEALAGRELLQRIFWLLALLMVAATVAVSLLYRRVRESHHRLAANHDQLKLLSERDPLTNLANRRHFHAVMSALGPGLPTASAGGPAAAATSIERPLAHDPGFEGALFLVDVDHFKRINDERGHAAGDEVLVEVARRLNQAVRGDDLVVRWGGEEFLILAPRADPEQAAQIAHRVLDNLARRPVVVGDQVIPVTVSIGYGRFPLPPHAGRLSWEQALNLADMALYTAKNQGRNRAVGIVAAHAAGADALRSIEADFDAARRQGRVELAQAVGPQQGATAPAGAPGRLQGPGGPRSPGRGGDWEGRGEAAVGA